MGHELAQRVVAHVTHQLPHARSIGGGLFAADAAIDASTTAPAERLQAIRDLTHGRGADVVVECAGVPQVIPEAIEMLRLGGMLVEAGNFSDLGPVQINPHRHLCSKSVRIIGVGGEEAAAYGPSMRQLVRYMQHYPVREFVSHRYRLGDVDAAVRKSIAPDSMKVVIDPWA